MSGKDRSQNPEFRRNENYRGGSQKNRPLIFCQTLAQNPHFLTIEELKTKVFQT